MGFTSAHLASLFTRIESGNLFTVERLGDAWDIGPAGQRIRDVFTKEPVADNIGRRALWHNNTGATQTMHANTDTYIHAKPDPRSQRLADRYWDQRSRLLLCSKVRLNLARVNSVRLPNPALGSLWVPARPTVVTGRRDLEKAMSAWFNSTLGWIAMIGVASPNVLSRPSISIDAMRRLPVPVLNAEQLEALAAVFDAHSKSTLGPLRGADADKHRVALDDAVAEALGIQPSVLATARFEIAQEPSTLQS